MCESYKKVMYIHSSLQYSTHLHSKISESVLSILELESLVSAFTAIINVLNYIVDDPMHKLQHR